MRSAATVIFSLAAVLTLAQPHHIKITVPPVSVTISPLATATFTCEGNGNKLYWLIQSVLLSPLIQQQRGITVTDPGGPGNLSSVLTIAGLPDNDGIQIGCQIMSHQPFHQNISSATLTIRGVSPVQNLNNFTSNNSLLITWSPPVYHSSDVPVGSPISYQVLVTNEDGDIILDKNTTNTNITVANITDCDTFNISVTALVDGYISIENTISNNGNYSIAEYGTQPLIPSISFELGCPPSKCLVSLMDGSTEVTDIITETEHIIEFKLSPFRHYELTAVVKNLRGKTKATYSTSISTFYTQDIIINSSYTNGSVSVQCVFVPGSTADGCHVIFTDTSNGKNDSFNITGLTLLSLLAGNYTGTAYDIINRAFYGPAVYYPTLVEIIKVIPSTSSSSTHDSISSTASSKVIPIPTSSTTIPTLGTETTSSTNETINDANSVIPIVAGILGGIVLLILILLAVCVSITVYKRKLMNVEELTHSGIATIQHPQAEANPYQNVHELMSEVPINPSPVILTYNRLLEEEHCRNQLLSDYHTIPSHNVEGQPMPQPLLPRPSTATQETTLEDSISSSTTSNDIHDTESTTEPNATDTITVTVNDTDTTAPPDNEATTVNAAATATVNDNTTDTVAPTYAVVTKRTDTTPLPAADQCVIYDKVTGDINKRGGGVTVYQPSDDISANRPPPSYADIIAQEHGTTVSSSQLVAPVNDDTAGVDNKYEKYPPTYTGDEYGIDQCHSIDDRRGALVPSNEDQDAITHFEKTDSFEKPESSFEEAKVGIGDEVVGVKPLSSTKEKGTLVAGVASKAELS